MKISISVLMNIIKTPKESLCIPLPYKLGHLHFVSQFDSGGGPIHARVPIHAHP